MPTGCVELSARKKLKHNGPAFRQRPHQSHSGLATAVRLQHSSTQPHLMKRLNLHCSCLWQPGKHSQCPSLLVCRQGRARSERGCHSSMGVLGGPACTLSL